METVLLDFDRIKIIEPHETDSVFITLESMRKLWLQRTNWHPALEIAGPDSNLEEYIHYYTLGSTLYMDARDRGWKSYKNLSEMYNRVLIKKLGWLYERFIFEMSEYLGECKYEDDLALPVFISMSLVLHLIRKNIIGVCIMMVNGGMVEIILKKSILTLTSEIN